MGILRKCKLLVKLLLEVQVYVFVWKTLYVILERKGGEAWFSHASIIRSIIKEYQVDLILDVGANRGQFSNEVRKFYKGPIISFEPVSRVFTALKHTTSHDKNWFVFNYALGNESKQQYINVYESDDYSSLLETNKYCVERYGEKMARPVKELI